MSARVNIIQKLYSKKIDKEAKIIFEKNIPKNSAFHITRFPFRASGDMSVISNARSHFMLLHEVRTLLSASESAANMPGIGIAAPPVPEAEAPPGA